MNGVSEGVSVVPRDIALLERGRDMRALGANIMVADFFDAGDYPLSSSHQSSYPALRFCMN